MTKHGQKNKGNARGYGRVTLETGLLLFAPFVTKSPIFMEELRMQVVILCGGQGTRIRDVADDIPKPMIPIGGKPIVWHIMKGYAQHGFTKFILCLGYKGWNLKRFFLDYHLAGADFTLRLKDPQRIELRTHDCNEDWEVTLVETGQDAMTGCRVARIEKYLEGDTFAVTYGDSLSDIDVARELEFHRKHGRLGTVSAVRTPGRFGEMLLKGQQVQKFEEKPPFTSGRINGGFFIFQREFCRRLSDDPTLILEREPLTRLAKDSQLMAFPHNGFWFAMDSSRDYQVLNDMWKSGQAPWCTWGQSEVRKAA